MRDILFSIITPVYNGKNYINDYLFSLKNQIYKKWEAIIIDDYSIDNSYEYLQDLTRDDNRFRIYKNQSKKNITSPYSARNYGLTKIKGTYICFLDIDDFWFPDKLKSDYYSINKLNSDILIGDYIKANQDLTKGYIKPRLNFLNIKFQLNFCNPFPILTTTIKKDIIGEIKFRAIHHEDYIFWREIIQNNKTNNVDLKIDINKSQNAIYRVNSNSLSFNRFKTIIWLKNCHEYLNTNKFITYIILLIRIIFFLLEKLAVSFKIIKMKNIKI